MVLCQLLWDVIFVVTLKIIDALVVLDHLDVHVGDAKSENVVLVLGIGDFRDGIMKHVVSHLVIEVIVSVFVQLMQVGKLRDLRK